jgi:hypothetical protein
MKTEHRLRLMLTSLSLALLLGCAPTRQEPLTRWRGDQATLMLEYRGQAQAVFAAGDWNGWAPLANPFQWRGGDRWLLELELPPGEHAYLLAVETDEKWEWKLDPANPVRTRDADGRVLSLLEVGTAADVDD